MKLARALSVGVPLLVVVALLGLVYHCQGSFVSTQLYPSCTLLHPSAMPNLSYAKGLQVANFTFPCVGVDTTAPPPPMTVTWYYYAIYPPAPSSPACSNLPILQGDQCCHTIATSSITFYNTTFVNGGEIIVGTATGKVTAGKFVSQSVRYELSFIPTTNCLTTKYGQESRVGTATLTITNGPACLNGGCMDEYCPGTGAISG